jgi:hypothetical protein
MANDINFYQHLMEDTVLQSWIFLDLERIHVGTKSLQKKHKCQI